MICTYRYRIKDSRAALQLNTLARRVNQVWNFCNESQEHALRWNQRWPTYQDLCKLTTGSSKALGLHSQSVQAVCEQYATGRQQCKKRKLRWRGSGRGKRGGLRIIYYWRNRAGQVWMLTLYAKSEQKNIPPHILRAIAEEISDESA